MGSEMCIRDRHWMDPAGSSGRRSPSRGLSPQLVFRRNAPVRRARFPTARRFSGETPGGISGRSGARFTAIEHRSMACRSRPFAAIAGAGSSHPVATGGAPEAGRNGSSPIARDRLRQAEARECAPGAVGRPETAGGCHGQQSAAANGAAQGAPKFGATGSTCRGKLVENTVLPTDREQGWTL